jgi:hypothetical protein
VRRALVLGPVLAAVAAGCASGPQASSLPGLTPTKLAKIEAMVRRDATADGDANPTSAVVYASRRHEANIATGAGTGVVGEQPVYLVVIQGDFTCTTCGGPPGHTPPHGTVITLVLGREKLNGLDFGIGGQQPDTSSLGPGVPVPLG